MNKEGAFMEKEIMNPPIESNWIDSDIIAEYNIYKDKKMVAKKFCITVKEVTAIVKGVVS